MTANWVELRVHGVSGTPPQDMLAAPVVVQVAGDSLGRFLRPADGTGRPLPATGGRVLEGYHWGLFTSGSFTQGLWFLLLPFGMVNAAAFMLPVTGSRALPAAARAVLRVLGLALTAVFTLGVVQVLVDALTWRGPAHGNPWWVLAAVAGCLAVLGLLVFVLGRGQVPPPPPGQAGALPEPEDDAVRGLTGLADRGFFQREPDAPLLRRLHLAVAVLVIGLPFAAVPGDGDDVLPTTWTAVLLALAAVSAAALIDPSCQVRRIRAPLPEGIPRAPWRWEAVTWGLLGLALATLVLDLAVGLRRPEQPVGPLPGLDGAASVLVLVGVACLLVLLLVVVAGAAGQRTQRQYGDRPDGTPDPFRPFVGGLTAWVVAALGTFLGLGFTVGVGSTVSWLLARRGTAVPVPGVDRSIALAWGVAAVLVLGLGIVAGAAGWARRPGRRARALAAYRRPFPQVAVEHPEVVDTATSATWFGGLKYSAGWAGAVFAAAGSLVGVVLAVGIVADLVTPGTPSGVVGGLVRLADGTFARSGTGLSGALVLGGNVLLVGFAGGLLLAGRGALLNPSTRRGLNVIWDVIAFWPREAHPIAPPPYSQRAVRDLADRITWLLTTDPGCRVVLAGHSQGSLICAATILRVRADLHPRIALLTHGSQLQYAYSRAFPGYLNAPYLRWLLRTLGDRWINLFRTTDPLGGPVLSWHRSPEEESARWQSARLTGTGVAQEEDDVDALGARRCGSDWRLLDPAVVDPSLRPWPGARRHSDFPRDPAWAVAVARLATALGVSPGPAVPPADGRAARPAAPPLRPTPPGSP